MSKHKDKKDGHKVIAVNRKASHEYFLEQKFEAGIVLRGWEVKSLRDGRAQLRESYVVMKDGEAFLLNAHISPLKNVAAHLNPDPTRTRKLLLHRDELRKLLGKIDRQGYALIPLQLYWKRGRVKLEFALAKGKKKYDKRASLKERETKREAQRAMKS